MYCLVILSLVVIGRSRFRSIGFRRWSIGTMERSPDVIILNPEDVYRLLVSKAASSGEYDSPVVVKTSDNGNMSIAGVAVVATTAQTTGTYSIVERPTD